MQKILGLDIGSYSIKAVEIINTFTTYKVAKFYEIAIPEIEGVEQSHVGATAMRQMFTENQIEVDRIYTAMMGLLVSMRVLPLANVKKRNIGTVVYGELEAQAPFPLDDVVIDQQILEQKDGHTTVLAVMCRQDHVQAYLNGLKELDIDPRIIDVDYLAFMNLMPFLENVDPDPAKAPQCRLILDIGHLKTSLVLFNGGKLSAARTIRIGGRYFTDFIAKNLALGFGDAQRLKHKISRIDYRGAGGTPTGGSQEDIAARKLGLAVSELAKELVRTLQSFRAQEKLFPEEILLTGGSSNIENITDYLQETLGIPVRRISFDSARLKVDEVDLRNTGSMPQALAIGMRAVPSKQNSQINLRRGDLALIGNYDTVVRQASGIALLAASVLVCLAASFGLRWWLYGNQIEALKQEYRKEFIETLGGSEPRRLRNLAATKNWDFKSYSDQATKFLQDEITNREGILLSFAQRKTAVPLRILEEVSKAIPKDVKVDLTRFEVQAGNVLIEGETDSFASSERILAMLKETPSLQNVERKSQENKPGSEGKVIKFIVAANLKEGA